MIDTNNRDKSPNLLNEFNQNDLLKIDIRNDYLNSEEESIKDWSTEQIEDTFLDTIRDLRTISLSIIEQLDKKHRYGELLSLISQPQLFPIWRKLISTQALATITASNLNIVIQNIKNKRAIQIIDTAIRENYDVFFNTILATNKNINKLSFGEQLFVFCEAFSYINVNKKNNESFSISANIQIILLKLMPNMIKKKNYQQLDADYREAINEVEVYMHYHEIGLSCFAKLAERLKLEPEDHTYDDVVFKCRDKTDFEQFIKWASDNSKIDNYHLVKQRRKQIKLGWYQRLTTKMPDNAKQNVKDIYQILANSN